ncbi:MAG: helix-turn-helix domain-containing protein [Clostridium sp.]|uniref:helix-turn-helix domain-containing protein n=1 Tax=Clostridium sp. TaxID=1506 RepID=UPI00307313CA
MTMEIGKKIKSLRVEKGVTQEALGNYLGISYQAVSKWENNVTSPDLQLLPLLSVYFGVTIDEFFQIPKDSHMERIENMIMDERVISNEKFNYADNFLHEVLKSEPKNARAYYLLAELHNHRSKSHHYVAAEYAKQALKYKPYEKDYHCALVHAENGVYGDYYYNRHDSLIEYYKEFTKKHPEYWSGYLYLLDQLIGDGHYDEAKDVITKAKKLKHTSLDYMYEGDIELAQGNLSGAINLWNKGVKEFGTAWEAYISRGDRMVKLGRYEDAIMDYEKCMELQKKPRLIDPIVFMANAHEALGEYGKAIDTLEQEIIILQEEHGIFSGEIIDKPKREIERLRKLLI